MTIIGATLSYIILMALTALTLCALQSLLNWVEDTLSDIFKFFTGGN